MNTQRSLTIRHRRRSEPKAVPTLFVLIMLLGLTMATHSLADNQIAYGVQFHKDWFPTDITDTIQPGDEVQFGATHRWESMPFTTLRYSWYIDGVRLADSTHSTGNISAATVSTIVFHTWVATPGIHTVRFVVDPDNFVSETIEGDNEVSRIFTVSIAANNPPSDIALSNSSLQENQPSGANVGTFSTSDSDSGDSHSYTLVSGAGSADNASFTISGSSLQASSSFNYETQSNFTVRIRSTDNGSPSEFFEEAFTVTVLDQDETPELFSMGPPSAGNIVLKWSSITNHTYAIHSSTNLPDGFAVVQNNIPATPPMNCYTTSVASLDLVIWKITTDL